MSHACFRKLGQFVSTVECVDCGSECGLLGKGSCNNNRIDSSLIDRI